jgi:hypothetical protein
MESPVAIAKSTLNPASLVKWMIAGIVGFAILDLLGVTDAILRPVTYAKMKFAKTS